MANNKKEPNTTNRNKGGTKKVASPSKISKKAQSAASAKAPMTGKSRGPAPAKGSGKSETHPMDSAGQSRPTGQTQRMGNKKSDTKPGKSTSVERTNPQKEVLKKESSGMKASPPQQKATPIKSDATQEMTAKTDFLTEYDIFLFREGKHHRLYQKLGSHLMRIDEKDGVRFAVWAPNAEYVSVIGDFNDWDRGRHRLTPHGDSGIWEVFVPGVRQGAIYKYYIHSHNRGYEAEKGDPFAMRWEMPPQTASVVWDLQREWKDQDWMKTRKSKNPHAEPLSIYEMHIGSWKRVPEDGNRSLSYLELAEQLPPYLTGLGFTHVEFLPVMEHPFFGSWGYQTTGYFAPSSRFGSPQDFMHLIETLHHAGIGVILDWVPSHFPSDLHGLHYFDGTHLYEHQDPNQGYHPDWKSYIYNYGRDEVRSFLISNALFWLDLYHADGLRVDAVASMLYLDYSREEGQWIPNKYGGRENLEAIQFLKEFNEAVYGEFPDVLTIAEESTAWPGVSRPTHLGGLGFGMKWMMGWMHDTLTYFQKDSIHRRHHQNEITFSIYYAFSENFVLPLSHDEVVYGKGSLIGKMPGDEWQRFANLRTMYAYMYAHPGAKLLFMGGEFAQPGEWNHDSSLEWHVAGQPLHRGIAGELAALNHLYRTEKALYEEQYEERGFEWIDIHDSANSVISFLRKSSDSIEYIAVICNFTPVPRENYRVGLPAPGRWTEIFNSDDRRFGGSDTLNREPVHAEVPAAHGRDQSVTITLPPLGVVFLKYVG